MHHGVAILSKVPIREDHAHDWQDNGEARHVGALLDCGIRIENVYIPAGGETHDLEANPKFRQKLAFLERMTRWSAKLRPPNVPLGRSEERRVGKAWVSRCRSRWSPCHTNKNKNT